MEDASRIRGRITENLGHGFYYCQFPDKSIALLREIHSADRVAVGREIPVDISTGDYRFDCHDCS